MQPSPLYDAASLRPAYHLRYGWTGWPLTGTVLPPEPPQFPVESWEGDGIRLLESSWSPDSVQITFSVKPHICPVLLAARAKGRLQHAMRQQGLAVRFSRKIGVRSIGDNRTADVNTYIRNQTDKEPFADPRFRTLLERFTFTDPTVDLSRPTETKSGRYWYNLHLVLVLDAAYRIVDAQRLGVIRDQSPKIAAKKGHAVSCLSVMPDHLHLALRGNLDHSPEEIALSFLNNLAFALGQVRVWRRGYYAGTFGEYNMNAVRRP